jgi:hypothetical protein
MDLRVKALIWAEMVSSGIVPMESSIDRQQVKIEPCLDGLSQEDARRLKRKFRKLWRKHKSRYCRPGQPSVSMMRKRKNEVVREFVLQAVKVIKKADPTDDVFPW